MTEIERNQIKGALLKCAKENENKPTFTGHIVVSSLCKSAVERIEELEKENAELDCQMNRNKYCYSCANVTDRCFRNEIGCPCAKYKSYKDENAELKEKVSYLEDNLRVARKDRKNLQREVGKGLKEFIKDCPYSALKFYANGYYAEQLTKAKEIIKDYLTIVKGNHTTVCGVPDDEVREDVEIRENNGEWHEPLVEVVE